MCQDIYSVLILDALVPLRQIYGLPDPLSGASIVDVALIPKFYRLEDPRCPYDGLLGGKKGRKRDSYFMVKVTQSGHFLGYHHLP